jgi:plastocyanin
MKHPASSSGHRTVLVTILGLGILAGCGGGSGDNTGPDTSFPATIDVFTPGAIFTPPTAEIRAGGVVRFIMTEAPDGDGHNANFNHAVAGAPLDVPVVKDTTVTRQFDVRGTFTYHCTVHPGMMGEVIVH